MASDESHRTTNPRDSVLEDGVFSIEDHLIGKGVAEIAAKRFPFRTDEGLNFCKLHTFDNGLVRGVLESVFARSILGLYKVFGRDSSRIYSFLNRTSAEVQVLIIQLWSNDSRIIFYKKSHLQSLDAKPAPNGLLEISPRTLEREGIIPYEVEMNQGGLSIVDGRLGFKIVRGFAIHFGFATEDEVKEWAKMPIPKQSSLLEKVAEMERPAIGTNFEFVE